MFDKYFDKEMLNLWRNNSKFCNKILGNDEIKNRLRKEVLDLVYAEKKNQDDK